MTQLRLATIGSSLATASVPHSPDTELDQLVAELFGPGLTSRGRWLVLAPHPDDETLGASWLVRRKRTLTLALVTDGAPRVPRLRPAEWRRDRAGYAQLRRSE